jgi:hypothetical protein
MPMRAAHMHPIHSIQHLVLLSVVYAFCSFVVYLSLFLSLSLSRLRVPALSIDSSTSIFPHISIHPLQHCIDAFKFTTRRSTIQPITFIQPTLFAYFTHRPPPSLLTLLSRLRSIRSSIPLYYFPTFKNREQQRYIPSPLFSIHSRLRNRSSKLS